MIDAWNIMANRLRIAPASVARTLIRRLDYIKPLSEKDESAILLALKNAPVEDATNRLLAHLSRNTLNKLLEEM